MFGALALAVALLALQLASPLGPVRRAPSLEALRARAEDPDANGVERVEMVALSDPDAVARYVALLGGEVEVRSRDRLQALVPAWRLSELAKATSLLRIEPPATFLPLQSAASSRSLLGVDRWRDAGYSGYQVKVAVLDAGFRGYSNRLGTTLPLGAIARSFRPDLGVDSVTDHGTLAAEVVHSIAPSARLYLLSFGTTTELSAAIDYMVEQRIDVVSFSLGFIHNGPGDGHGPVDSIIGRSVDAGALWSVAAGNWARQHWSGVYTDSNGDSVHEFAPDVQLNGRNFSSGDLIIVSLRWDDPWGASCGDYDLELFGPTGTLVRASRRTQDCSGDPVENLQVLATESGRYSVRIINPGAAEPRRLDLLIVGSPDRGDPLDFFVPGASLSEPADHPGVVTVGAINDTGAPRMAAFSSRGPTADGRAKPEVVSPTGVGAPGQASFAGTSAAAPHVAGMAALLREAFPGTGGATLRQEIIARSALLTESPAAGAPERLATLGPLSGLGPLLPAGADNAGLVGSPPRGAGLGLMVYLGPDAYPVRFVHLLSGGRLPVAVFRFDQPRQEFDRYIIGAPARVQTFDTLSAGTPYVIRYDSP